MEDNWYYAQNNKQSGPVSQAALYQWLQSGQIDPSVLVWRQGMAEWQPARDLPQFRDAVAGSRNPPMAVGYQPQSGYSPSAGPAQPLAYAIPAGFDGSSAPPKTWLWQSIACLLCCWPLAIVAIVYAAQVNSKWAGGDYVGAQHSSNQAALFVKISFFLGLAAFAMQIVFSFIGMASR